MNEIHIIGEIFENFYIGGNTNRKINLCGTNIYNSDGSQKKISLYWAYQWNKYYRKHNSKEIIPDINDIACVPCKNHILQHIHDVEDNKISTLYGFPIFAFGDLMMDKRKKNHDSL